MPAPALWAALVVATVLYGAGSIGRPPWISDVVFDVGVYNIVYAAGAWLCWLPRTDGPDPDRWAWRLLSLALLSSLAANVYYTLVVAAMPEPPYPSAADWLYLAFYPLVFVALVRLFRTRVGAFQLSMWLDGLVAGLGAAAVVVAVALEPVLTLTDGALDVVLVNLAYPVADLVLLMMIVAIGAMLGLRLDRPLRWLAAGMALYAFGDVVFLLTDSAGTYVEGGLLDVVWLLAVGTTTYAARIAPADGPGEAGTVDRSRVGWRVVAVPMVASTASIGLLVAGWAGDIPTAAGIFAGLAAAVASLRVLLTFHEIRDLPEVRRQARTDELTGLANRRVLYERCDERLGAGAPTALLLLDLDGFKDVNDSFGHHAGDHLLREVAARLDGDCGADELLVRLGGDEFAILTASPSAEAARARADAVHAVLADPFAVESVRVFVACSIGVSLAGAPAGSLGELLRFADVAMYDAKSQGRGVTEVYVPDANDTVENRLRMIDELRTAMDTGQLVVHLQPQVALDTGTPIGVEALVRWQHPTRGLLAPGAFLSYVEIGGLESRLADIVLDGALAAATQWWHEVPVPVSVNLSVHDVTDAGLPARVEAALERHGLPATALTVELTEGTLMRHPGQARRVLGMLRDRGVRVSIDDYGSGYSSLAYLRDVPADELKLDRSFCADTGLDPRADGIVRHTVGLAEALGLTLVAEGIELPSTQAALSSLGCRIGQGYLFARPMPATDVTGWIRTAVSGHTGQRMSAAA